MCNSLYKFSTFCGPGNQQIYALSPSCKGQESVVVIYMQITLAEAGMTKTELVFYICKDCLCI